MARKQALTKDNVETDIRKALQHPANQSRSERHRSMIPLYVFSALELVAMLIFQSHYKLILVFSLIFIAVYLTVDHARRKNSIKAVSLDRYDVTEKAVSHIQEEIYSTEYSTPLNRKPKEVRVYIMYFEDGTSWNIPKDNYTWSQEAPMTDKILYQLTHRGDVFTVVTKKDSGETVMAYPTAYFDYKE